MATGKQVAIGVLALAALTGAVLILTSCAKKTAPKDVFAKARAYFDESQQVKLEKLHYLPWDKPYGGTSLDAIVFLSSDWTSRAETGQYGQIALLIHEYLHVVTCKPSLMPGAHPYLPIVDEFYTVAEPYARTILQEELYQQPLYTSVNYPMEAFAMIGTIIALKQGSVPADIRLFYKGFLR